jgi:hypothetical protein
MEYSIGVELEFGEGRYRKHGRDYAKVGALRKAFGLRI